MSIMLPIRTLVPKFRLAQICLHYMGMATEIKHGAQADFEGRGSCEDPLTSRLISEHRGLEGLFLQYEQLPSDTDPQERLQLGYEMIRQISLHAATEEMVLYPAIAKHQSKEAAERLLAETYAVQQVLADLDATSDPADKRVAELVHKTIQMTREHIKDEESNCLPQLSRALPPSELQRLARQFAAARGIAPTRPHPYAPIRPPWNVPAMAAAVPVDMVRDAARFGLHDLKTEVDKK